MTLLETITSPEELMVRLRDDQRGRYVVIEGIDGAGKTTQVERLRDWLIELGIKSEVVREPGGDPFAEILRSAILNTGYAVTPLAEHFAFHAARANLRELIIQPLLEAGTWVLADRSEASSLVYQSYAGGLDVGMVWRDVHVVQTIARPDIFMILQIDEATQAERRPVLDDGRFEQANAEFRRKLFQGYQWVVSYLESRGLNAVSLDGTSDFDTVFATICDHVAHMI